MTRACSSCGAALADGSVLACPACGALAPVDPRATPFQRLGLPQRFDLAAADVERAWLSRSRIVHPDRFAAKSPAERRTAAEHTAALNDAYRALKDPFDRASWLVKHAGVDVGQLDQRLLVQLMEARERAEDSDEGRAAVVAESVARFHALAATLPPLLAEGGDPSKAARALAEMKTLARLVDDLRGPRLIATLEGR